VPAKRTPLALAVLTLLDERPMHPYEMRQVITERGLDRVLRLMHASLYDTVVRLTRAGLVEAADTGREGRRPERTVYRITAAGHDEVRAWLGDLLAVPLDEFPQFGTAVAFLHLLTPEDTARLLTRRGIALESGLAADDALIKRLRADGLERQHVAELEYRRVLRAAELDWVRSVVADIRAGRMSWQVPDGRDPGAQPPRDPDPDRSETAG
jgi:DNA-binding PadR family transcriptional regulator